MSWGPVIHICNTKTLHGSRLAMEQPLAPGRVIISEYFNPTKSAIQQIRAVPDGSVLVFHELENLALSIMMATYARAARRKWRIVFDLHDLPDRPMNQVVTPRRRAMDATLYRLLQVLPKFDIPVITVSEGLAKVLQDRLNVSADVVFSLPPGHPRPVTPPDVSRIVYFGMINGDRIPIGVVHQLADAGMALDVYGRYSPFARADFPGQLEPVLEQTGGSVLGPYSPGDLTFLNGYSASLMLFQRMSVNYQYSMPNKLFQSLQARLVCVVSDHLQEMRETFEHTGAVQTLEQFLDGPRDVDWAAVDAIMATMAADSRANYLRALGVSSQTPSYERFPVDEQGLSA